SPDGGHIAYSTDVRDTGQEALFVVAADGTGATKVTDGSFWSSRVWSPDGSRLAYVRYEDRQEEDYVRTNFVEVFGVGGENPVTLGELTRSPLCYIYLTWRPNGVEYGFYCES
ncbi:MAG: hypothetical protein OXL98_12350, partial [Acidimicrobiaceae bacterium]|nr:hypothetical protein [Acidimicrobiaceae bacterium]